MFVTTGKRHLKVLNPATAAEVVETRGRFTRGDETVTLAELFQRAGLHPTALAESERTTAFAADLELETGQN